MADSEAIQNKLEELRTWIQGGLEAVGLTIQQNGWNPLAGSQAAAELAGQHRFAKTRKAPVLDAYSVAGIRLASATEHLSGLRRLLADPPSAFASATVARAALENSARASWALDPKLDVRMRIARGRTDTIRNLIEATRYRIPDLTAKVMPKLERLLADTETDGLDVKCKNGRFVGIEEEAPGPTEIIRHEVGGMGTMAYRDLSSVAHGDLSGLLERMKAVEVRTESILMAPDDASSHIPSFAVALSAFASAQERRMRLFGWDPQHFIAWRKASLETIRGLLATPQDRGSLEGAAGP